MRLIIVWFSEFGEWSWWGEGKPGTLSDELIIILRLQLFLDLQTFLFNTFIGNFSECVLEFLLFVLYKDVEEHLNYHLKEVNIFFTLAFAMSDWWEVGWCKDPLDFEHIESMTYPIG